MSSTALFPAASVTVAVSVHVARLFKGAYINGCKLPSSPRRPRSWVTRNTLSAIADGDHHRLTSFCPPWWVPCNAVLVPNLNCKMLRPSSVSISNGWSRGIYRRTIRCRCGVACHIDGRDGGQISRHPQSLKDRDYRSPMPHPQSWVCSVMVLPAESDSTTFTLLAILDMTDQTADF